MCDPWPKADDLQSGEACACVCDEREDSSGVQLLIWFNIIWMLLQVD